MNSFYAFFSFLSTFVAASIILIVWRRRTMPGGKYLIYLSAALAIWSFCYGCHWLAVTETARAIWMNLAFVGVLTAPAALLLFVLRFTNQIQRLPKRITLLLTVEPLITYIILWTDPYHGLFYRRVVPTGMIWDAGVWFWLNVVYSYILAGIAAALLMRAWLTTVRPLRPQLVLILLGLCVPIVVNLASLLGLAGGQGLDLTPFSFLISSGFIVLALLRFGLFDIVPIARSALFERMTDSFIVLDAQNRVVDINETALKILGKASKDVIGEDAGNVFAEFGDWFQRHRDTLVLQQEIALRVDPPLILDLRITPLYDRKGRYSGRLMAARDVTERKKAERAEHEQRVLAEALRDSLAALSRSRTFDEVLDKILDNVGRVVPFDLATFMLADDYGMVHAIRHRGYREHGLEQFAEEFHFPSAEFPNFERMLETQKSIVVPDTYHSKDWVPIEGLEWIRSYVGAPILVRDRVIGFLDLCSFTPNFFSQLHADRLQAFADEAAIAIENARLLEETQQRAEQMAALFDIGLAITSGLNRDNILKRLLEKCQKVLPLEAFYVAIYDPETELIYHPLFYDNGEFREVPARHIREQPGLSGHIIQTRQTIYIQDALAEETTGKYQIIHAGGQMARSYVGVPMTIGDRAVGVISMQSYHPDAYNQAQIRFLETIATQAAIAIENTRLFDEIRSQAEQMTALFDIGITITSGLDWERVLQAVLEKCRQVLPVEAFYIALFDAESGEIRYPLAYDLGEYPRIPSRNLHKTPGLSEHVIKTRQTLYIPDMLDSDMAAAYQIFQTSGTPTRSYIGVPMIIGERVVGVISIQSYQPAAYSLEHIRLLETIAMQAAVAIENSQLYAMAQQEILDRRIAEQRYRALFEQSHDAVFIIDFDGKHLESNWRASNMLGYSSQEILALHASDIYARPAEGVKILAELLAGKHIPLYESHFRRKDGSEIVVEVNAELVCDSDGKPLHIQKVARDITERKRDELAIQNANQKLRAQLARIKTLQTQLRQQAIRDPLTGLFNRRYLEEVLQREIAVAERQQSNISVVMIDIDRFKKFNDTYGHDAGDFLLKELAELLRREVRRSDISCRYGGEEFLIVMPGATLEKGAERAEHIRQAFSSARYEFMGSKLKSTLSLGVASYPQHGKTWEECVHAADRAMYAAKAAGKNRVRSA
jgi:diguanylate cyclase (GGDEF)-like protein/PAS domain S-box-containing protein